MRDSGVEIGLVGGKDRYDFQEERMAAVTRWTGCRLGSRYHEPGRASRRERPARSAAGGGAAYPVHEVRSPDPLRPGGDPRVDRRVPSSSRSSGLTVTRRRTICSPAGPVHSASQSQQRGECRGARAEARAFPVAGPVPLSRRAGAAQDLRATKRRRTMGRHHAGPKGSRRVGRRRPRQLAPSPRGSRSGPRRWSTCGPPRGVAT